MSYVTGVVLTTSLEAYEGDTDEPGECHRAIRDWLASRGFEPLEMVDRTVMTGPKCMEMAVGCGGYNYFPAEEFGAFVMALDWRDEERVALVLSGQDSFDVLRPGSYGDRDYYDSYGDDP